MCSEATCSFGTPELLKEEKPKEKKKPLPKRKKKRRMKRLVVAFRAPSNEDYSLRAVLDNRRKRKFFKLFAAKEHSVENVLFYEKVHEFKETRKLEERITLAKNILKTFVDEDSLLAINISVMVGKGIHNELEKQIKVGKCESTLFDECLSELISGVMNDTFDRFRESALFVQMKKRNDPKAPFKFHSRIE